MKNILSLDNPLHWMIMLMMSLYVKNNGSVFIIMHYVIQAIIMAEQRVNCGLK
jgi:phage shock protein PspC (stress-responsive transcriptional regulator)